MWSALREGIEQIARSLVMDRRDSINPKRVALAKIFYIDYKTNHDKLGLSLADLSKIMFESEDSHVLNYFYYIDKSKNKLTGTRLEFLLKKSGGEYSLDEHSHFFSERLRITGPTIVSEIYELIDSLEKDELASDQKLKENLAKIREDTDFGLLAIKENYIEFLEKASGKERERFVQSLRERKPHVSTITKLGARVARTSETEILRLGLDAWGYSMFDMLFGHKVRDTVHLDFKLEESIARHTADMIIESQHEKIGSWAVGNYDVAFQVMDTSIVLQLLSLIKTNFSSISIPADSLIKAKEFITNTIETADDKIGKVSYCRVEHPISRQNTLLATLSALTGLFRVHTMLGYEPSTFFESETPIQILRYVMTLKDENGGFRVKTEEKISDPQSTSLISKGLMAKENFGLDPEKIYELTKIRFDPIKTLGFIQGSLGAIDTAYIAEGHLNVAADNYHTAIACGALPVSSHIIKGLLDISSRAKQNLSVINDSNFWTLFTDTGSKYKAITAYRHSIKSVHVLHEVLFCLRSIEEYIVDPDAYWNRLAGFLKVHKA